MNFKMILFIILIIINTAIYDSSFKVLLLFYKIDFSGTQIRFIDSQ